MISIDSNQDILMAALAENIRRFRQAAGLSQKDLASAIGTSHPRISEIENGSGNPTIKTLERIASVLTVDIVDLFERPKSAKKTKK